MGNRLTQETHEEANTYLYDAANRLIDVDGVAYTWSANGNLLSDGVSAYAYDHANRLLSVAQGADIYAFAYNGSGDRLQQTLNGVLTAYELDINSHLTQVLGDGDKYYLYGLTRIGEEQTDGWKYHQVDVLGSVRQLVNDSAEVELANSYEPFGSSQSGFGSIESTYGFAGEWIDGTGMIYLRARYYQPEQGRFLQPDPFVGNMTQPISLNPYVYGFNNPALYTDPSGNSPIEECLVFWAVASVSDAALPFGEVIGFGNCIRLIVASSGLTWIISTYYADDVAEWLDDVTCDVERLIEDLYLDRDRRRLEDPFAGLVIYPAPVPEPPSEPEPESTP